jgi:hypothetical protein
MQLVMIIQFFRKFCIDHKAKLSQFSGGKTNLKSVLAQFRENSPAYRQNMLVFQRLIDGEFGAMNEFIFELICYALHDPFRQKIGQIWITNIILNTEYHVVRSALDCLHETTLYVCLMNRDYLADIWLRYIRRFHPSLLKHPKPGRRYLQKERFFTVVFYLPSPNHFIYEDPSKISAYTRAFFIRHFTHYFREGIVNVVIPDEKYQELTLAFPKYTETKEEEPRPSTAKTSGRGRGRPRGSANTKRGRKR